MWFRQILDFRVKDLKFSIFVNLLEFLQRGNDLKVHKSHQLGERVPIFRPRTHKICDIKNFFGIKFGDFVKIWNLANFVKFEILNPSENQNLRSLTLDHKIWILTTKISIFDEFWTNLMKILTKIEIWDP